MKLHVKVTMLMKKSLINDGEGNMNVRDPNVIEEIQIIGEHENGNFGEHVDVGKASMGTRKSARLLGKQPMIYNSSKESEQYDSSDLEFVESVYAM